MPNSLKIAVGFLAAGLAGLSTPVLCPAQSLPSIRRVQVLGGRGQVEIEIEASDRLLPRANVLTGPDRLVVDFVNAVPGVQLRNQAVNRGAVKSMRVGLFSSDPPVTRVVLDLNGPQPYQVFPSGRTVIVKIGETAGLQAAAFPSSSGPVLVNAKYSTQNAQDTAMPPASRPRLEVSFGNGLLSISSNKASLSEILFAVHQRTGAEIAIPAGAEQEQVAADLGPGPAPEVLARLLNGSKFNFMILSSASDPRALDRVILSARGEGPIQASMPQIQPSTPDEEAEPPAAPVAAGENPNSPAGQAAPPAQTGDVPN